MPPASRHVNLVRLTFALASSEDRSIAAAITQAAQPTASRFKSEEEKEFAKAANQHGIKHSGRVQPKLWRASEVVKGEGRGEVSFSRQM